MPNAIFNKQDDCQSLKYPKYSSVMDNTVLSLNARDSCRPKQGKAISAWLSSDITIS